MLKIMKLRASAKIPCRATSGSAGYDLCADLEQPCEIAPGETRPIPTGIAMAIPENYGGFVFARSGLALKHGLAPANCVGVIDSDYRGEVLVALRNHSDTPFTIHPGDRIAQLVLLPVTVPEVLECACLEETGRGAGGFGSTGR